MDIGTMFKEKNITNNFNNRNLCQSVLIRENLCYDNAGNRFIKQTKDVSTNKKNTSLYLRHGQIAVAMDIEITGDSTTDKGKINRYVLSGDLLAGRVTTTVKLDDSKVTEKYYYHLDHLNSTKCVTKADGTLDVMYEYRAFGEQLKKLGGSAGSPTGEAKYTYGGKELDDETNLYYFNARFYDATIGRFINVDPIQDGTNWYIYCNNNPLSFVDPTGLETKDVAFKDMNAKDQMSYLKNEFAKGMKAEGNDRGKIASDLRGLRDQMKLDGLFKNDEKFMNGDLRDFLNLKEDGTMNYKMSDLTKEKGWTEMSSVGSQYHQTNTNGTLNAKFVNEDGREVVINSNNEVIKNYPDKGTFNYVNGNMGSSILFGGHKLYDMDPYERLMKEKKITTIKRDNGDIFNGNSASWNKK